MIYIILVSLILGLIGGFILFPIIFIHFAMFGSDMPHDDYCMCGGEFCEEKKRVLY